MSNKVEGNQIEMKGGDYIIEDNIISTRFL